MNSGLDLICIIVDCKIMDLISIYIIIASKMWNLLVSICFFLSELGVSFFRYLCLFFFFLLNGSSSKVKPILIMGLIYTSMIIASKA